MSGTMDPSRAGHSRLGRTARWKLATTSPRRMLASHVQLLIPRGAVRGHCGCAVCSRPKGCCGCHRRIDRMLVTDPKAEARARPTAKCSGAMSEPSSPGPPSPPTTHRFVSGDRENLQPRDIGAANRPPARAARPNRVSLPHKPPDGNRRPTRTKGRFPALVGAVAPQPARAPGWPAALSSGETTAWPTCGPIKHRPATCQT